jgi:hypothetical protein
LWKAGKKLVAAATTAAAGAASSGAGSEGFGGAASDGGAKDGKLDAGFFAGALGAGDFLLSVEDELFELGFAVVADVFVDGHLCIIARDSKNKGRLGSRPLQKLESKRAG